MDIRQERMVRHLCPPDVDADRWVRSVSDYAAAAHHDVIDAARILRESMDAYAKPRR